MSNAHAHLAYPLGNFPGRGRFPGERAFEKSGDLFFFVIPKVGSSKAAPSPSWPGLSRTYTSTSRELAPGRSAISPGGTGAANLRSADLAPTWMTGTSPVMTALELETPLGLGVAFFLFFPCNPLKLHETTKEKLGDSKEKLGDSKEKF
jgi:hypothetical protein